MNNSVIPLAVPKELHRDIKRGAKETRLSQADVMRQSISIGLPRLRAALSHARHVTLATAGK
jgi:hypothetical protein